MNTQVNFETAKLLKEKGFDEPCNYYYELEYAHLYPKNTIHTWDPMFETKFKNSYQWEKAAAPTIADVCMWLYEKHGIWIAVNRVVIGSDEWDYSYIISYLPKEYEFEKRRSKHLVEIQSFKEGVGSYHGAWHTPTEAYEVAITYCLENLIQGGNK